MTEVQCTCRGTHTRTHTQAHSAARQWALSWVFKSFRMFLISLICLFMHKACNFCVRFMRASAVYRVPVISTSSTIHGNRVCVCNFSWARKLRYSKRMHSHAMCSALCDWVSQTNQNQNRVRMRRSSPGVVNMTAIRSPSLFVVVACNGNGSCTKRFHLRRITFDMHLPRASSQTASKRTGPGQTDSVPLSSCIVLL